ncbi:MAG: SRPBCC domain-containing protein [Cytophagia bacterium]|nr:SRPBCC domain-containing protein [Cytophagia bacterium]
MKSALLMDFTVDKENCRVNVKREFAAPLNLVWDAWTNPDVLDKWWAPRPYQTVTKSMDFKVGGRWHYHMKGPQGDIHWCLADYKSIDIEKEYQCLDAFCNEEMVINETHPRSYWTVAFEAQGDKTLVKVEIQHEKLSDLEMIIEMGFKEGFTMALGNLDEVLG